MAVVYSRNVHVPGIYNKPSDHTVLAITV